MKRLVLPIILAVASITGGCASFGPGTKRSLGEVDFDEAFGSAANVFSRYFKIAEADMFTGEIKSEPERFEDGSERIIDNMPTRRLASLNLYRKNGDVFARATVEIQQLQPDRAHQSAWAGENYDTVPNQSPAEMEAATTPQQNRNWETIRYDHQLEHAILSDLQNRLHPQEQE